MKKFYISIFALILPVIAVSSISAGEKAIKVKPVRNVILMIPDGMSVDGVTLTRWIRGGEPLAMDSIICGLIRTYSADAPIADSAPAATAMATGFKSHTGFIGVLPDQATMPGQAAIAENDKRRPIATILEAARLSGRATGIVATCEIMHATPAAFAAHDPSRKNYDALSEQELYAGIDVVLGGGSKFFRAEERGDNENLTAEIKPLGYTVVKTPAELTRVKNGKVWGTFADADMKYEIDRDSQQQPSLCEMTAKSIEVLSQNKKGFFLMVEGSKIDWAAHANDPAGIVSDIGAFDDAVRTALEFAEKDGSTAVLICPDHGNSGITMGNSTTSKGYDTKELAAFIDPLRAAKRTGEGVEALLSPDRSNLSHIVKTWYGIADLSKDETDLLKAAKKGSFNEVIGLMLAKRACIGFTTGGHTGEDVILGAYPFNNRPAGVVNNSDIAQIMAQYLSVDLAAATKLLFVEAYSAFKEAGAEVKNDSADIKNPVLVVTKGARTIKIPVNKNIAIVDGRTIPLPGIVVFNGTSWFVPKAAVDLIR